jgi:hypothetical protein
VDVTPLQELLIAGASLLLALLAFAIAATCYQASR